MPETAEKTTVGKSITWGREGLCWIKGTQRCQLCLYTHVKGCHADCQGFQIQERRPFYKTILLLSPDDDHAVGRQRTVDLEFSILRRQGANGIEIKDM
jgi:hypothetical protein